MNHKFFSTRATALPGRLVWRRETPVYDTVVIGGGIGGLSVADQLQKHAPGRSVLLLEKESTVGRGTSNAQNNTGTTHTAAFYKNPSIKATAAQEGFWFLYNYHEEKGLLRRDTGKIIAASEPGDEELLRKYYEQAIANGQRPERTRLVRGDELREQHEPLLSKNVTQGLLLQDCFLFDADGVMRALEADIKQRGGEIGTGHKVISVVAISEGWLVTTNRGEFIAVNVVNCAGTHADRMARLVGGAQDWKIMPVLGAYLQLNQVVDWRTAVYEPTRNPPFLGVHVMPGKDGKPFMGPDVFFSLLRERYGNETDSQPGLFRLALEWADNVIGLPRGWKEFFSRHGFIPNAQFYFAMAAKADGRAEVLKHFYWEAFARDTQRLINPELLELHGKDLEFLRSGIRAQAISTVTGKVLQDLSKEEIINPLNPNSRFISDKMPGSPGFTASVGKGRWLIQGILQ